MSGNGIAFKLRYKGATAPSIGLQVGAKLAVGSSATLKCNGSELVTLTTSTNMFYKLPALTWTKDGCAVYGTFSTPEGGCEFMDNGYAIFYSGNGECIQNPQEDNLGDLCYHVSTDATRMFMS